MRDPGSVWAPLPEAGAPDGYVKTQFIVHSTGSTSTARQIRDNYFAREDVVVESTFIVGKSAADPTLQIMDSSDNADANVAANQRGISVETVGTGNEPFTDWQVQELIRLGRWAAARHPIEKRIIPREPDSGFGWHVMFGAPGPWTTVRGKVCPGDLRIQQLKSTIFPAIFQEDDLTDTQAKQLAYLYELFSTPYSSAVPGSTDVKMLLRDFIRTIEKQATGLKNTDVPALARRVDALTLDVATLTAETRSGNSGPIDLTALADLVVDRLSARLVN